jgi:hypothetical protein
MKLHFISYLLNRAGFFPLKLKSGKFYISPQFYILIIVNLRDRMYCRHQNDADPQHSNVFFEKKEWIWDLCEYRFQIWMKTKICHCPLVSYRYVLGKNEVISTENVAPCPPQAVFFPGLSVGSFTTEQYFLPDIHIKMRRKES